MFERIAPWYILKKFPCTVNGICSSEEMLQSVKSGALLEWARAMKESNSVYEIHFQVTTFATCLGAAQRHCEISPFLMHSTFHSPVCHIIVPLICLWSLNLVTGPCVANSVGVFERSLIPLA